MHITRPIFQHARIDRMSSALEVGGYQNAEQLGKDLGALIWQVGAVATGVGAAAKAGVKLAEVGISVGSKRLEAMKPANSLLKADAKGLGGGGPGVIEKIDKAVDAAKAADKLPSSPVDIAHTIGADYNAKSGKVTGGHALINNDVKVTEVVSPPDANGVYEAKVNMKTPDGNWVAKKSNSGVNSMFPTSWDAAKIQREIDSACVQPGDFGRHSPVVG